MENVLRFSNILAMIICLMSSCTIKEDRMECPCKLGVDCQYCSGKWQSVCFELWDIKTILSEEYGPEFTEIHYYDVRRGLWQATAYAGVEKFNVGEGTVIISQGSQSDKLFAFSASVDATGEDAMTRVVPHKQYACLTLDLSTYADPGYSYDLEVVGDVCGLNLLDLTPVGGDFDYVMPYRRDGMYEVLVPRQKDASLQLLFWKDGELIDTVQLGKLIVQAGYDWSAEDLEDVTVTICQNKTDIVVRVVDWDVCDTIEDCII